MYSNIPTETPGPLKEHESVERHGNEEDLTGEQSMVDRKFRTQ